MRMELVLPSDPAVVAQVRRQLEAFLAGSPIVGDALEELKVAVSEACANAICHGSPRGRESSFRFTARLTDEELLIEVEDEGRGFGIANEQIRAPEDLRPSGRGLFLMRCFSDDFRIAPGRDGTVVEIGRRLAALSNGNGAAPTRPAPRSRAVGRRRR
jgi:serine/threonine-protein kinase RsbW